MYLAQEIPPEDNDAIKADEMSGNNEARTHKIQELAKNTENAKLCACKVVERANLDRSKEALIISEIQN